MMFPIPRFPQTFREAASFMRGSVIGIDIGTWSTKVVQLRKNGDEFVLESYGDIRIAPYLEDVPQAGSVMPERIADALLDLMAEVQISTHTAGLSVPTPATFLTVIETPIRDAEQMNRIIPNEAKKYIPSELKDVILNWFIIPDEHNARNAFEMLEKGSTVSGTKKQKVLIAAINGEVVKRYDNVLDAAGIAPVFYEIEAFSGLRSAAPSTKGPVLLMDCGASTTKLYVVEHNMIRMSHVINMGGVDLTRRLADELEGDLDSAEHIKCTHGLMSFPLPEDAENKKITRALTAVLKPIVEETRGVISEYKHAENKDIAQLTLFGGTARLAHIDEYLSDELGISVEIARPFGQTRGPRVLEGSLHEAGPVFAGAIGLAIRSANEKESVTNRLQYALRE